MTNEEYARHKRRQYFQQYYRDHRDSILAKNKEYNEANRERLRQYHTAYMREYRKRNAKPKPEEAEK